MGERLEVLVESIGQDGEGGPDAGVVEGRAAHQGPEVDGVVVVSGAPGARVGDVLSARVVGSQGIDLYADALGTGR